MKSQVPSKDLMRIVYRSLCRIHSKCRRPWKMNLSNENCCYQIGVELRVLRRIWVLDSIVFHERLKVYHGESAVFWIIAQLLGCQALFQDALKDHTIQRPVTHASVVLN